MKILILGSKNEGKLKEVRQIMSDISVDIISMKQADIDIDIEEDGKTFEENAIKKAEEIMRVSNAFVLADDSGLEIDYLEKMPGIYSSRYLGEDTSYRTKNKIILEKLRNVPKEKRTARFICAIALASPGGETEVVRGVLEGYIGFKAVGDKGFGYDPIFYVEEFGTSTADIDEEVKNKISHRAIALNKMKRILKEKVGT